MSEPGLTDADRRQLANMAAFSRSWQGDKYLLVVTYRDGSEDHYTGRKLAVTTGSEVSGETHTVQTKQ